jgi:hypothetical protein
VNAVAEMAVNMTLSGQNATRELRWATFLAGNEEPAKPSARRKRKAAIPASMNLRISE